MCPPNQNVTAVKLQTWQIVNWTEPVASDDRDGRIRSEIIHTVITYWKSSCFSKFYIINACLHIVYYIAQ